MTARLLWEKLQQQRIRVTVVDGELRVRGNKAALKESGLVPLLREHKQALVALIESQAVQVSLDGVVQVPPNRIVPGTTVITPEMLPLVRLSQEAIDGIVAKVPGGAANVQDIYPLAPLQEGMLFHHLMEREGDAYLLSTSLAFSSRTAVDEFVGTLQVVIARHDILRTAVMWEGLEEPVQVVQRRAPLPVETVALDAGCGDVVEQLKTKYDPRHHRIDISAAPLLRGYVAEDAAKGRWVLLLLYHHLVDDATSLRVVVREIAAIQAGAEEQLERPVPFRNFVAQARLGVGREEHEAFFRALLGDIDEPTLPFGLAEVQGDGTAIEEAQEMLDLEVAAAVRECARRLGVSAASVMHLAMGLVLARTSGRGEVVFGTVMSGRMGEGAGADRALGLFINTVPVRIRVGEQGVERSVRETHALLGQLTRHEHAPLALAQRCSRVPAQIPLFSALLNYRHSPVADAGATPSNVDDTEPGIVGLGAEERTNYPFAVSVDDLGEGFRVTAQVSEGVGAARVCGYMVTAVARLVEALDEAPELAVRRVEVMPAWERRLVLEEWNATEAEYPGERCIHELFEAEVERRPEAVAVVYGEESVSYADLNAEANRLARCLIEDGVGVGDCVAIALERSIGLVVAELAILKAGGSYVPLDAVLPGFRQVTMLEDCQAKVIVTERSCTLAPEVAAEVAAKGRLRRIDVDDGQLRKYSSKSLRVKVASEGAAYVMYTSGTTGVPKGVVVPHRAVVRLVVNNGYADFGPSDGVAFAANPAFDASTMEVWGPLVNGGRVVVIGQEVFLDPERFALTLQEKGVTVLFLTTALFNQYARTIARTLSQVRVLLTGGERNDPQSFALVLRENGPGHLVHCYGPTETTTFAITKEITEVDDDAKTLPLGRPIGNTQVYLLDANQEPVPVGVAGEMYIGGVGVARGYLNKPDLTAERFVADPYSLAAGARMYRTGDIGRWLANGTVEYLGRNDNQVKVRGYRIELGEIETRLGDAAGAGEVVVMAREDQPGDKRLVAYYTGEAEPEALREQARGGLPEYMVPAAYVRLERLPLTANGKIDRKALPAPEGDAYGREYEAPRGAVEEKLAGIWGELLGLERVGRNDNFFEVGGHSLLAMRLASRVREILGVEIGIGELFANPVLRELAVKVAGAGGVEGEPIRTRAREGAVALSLAQQRLWFVSQFEGASGAYHISGNVRLQGVLDRGALVQALERVVARHEALRTRFVVVDGQPMQVIDPVGLGLRIEEPDLRQEIAREEAMRALIEEEGNAAFDLERGPLIRARLVQLEEQDHVLMVTMHHIVSDGWSMGVLMNEVSALYGAYSGGGDDPLPALPIQYADYALWQRERLAGDELQRQIEYWKEALSGAPVRLELPSDRKPRLERDYAGDNVEIVLGDELSRGLKALSHRHGCTLYMTLLAGWGLALARLAGQEEVVIGSPVAGRSRSEIEGLIGFFVNTLAMRVEVGGRKTVAALLSLVRARVLAAQERQELPFEQVVEAVQPSRSTTHTPVFQVMFAWQNAPEGRLALTGLQLGSLGGTRKTAQFDLTLDLQETKGSIRGVLNYATALFDRGTVERYLGCFRRVLEGMVTDDTQEVSRLPLMGEAERRQVLEEWNAPDAEAQSLGEQCIHELFEEAAERWPEAVAVMCGEESVSYAELNVRANRLAHHLRKHGVKPDGLVGICAERSVEMVVALLGVLKAGGAYVPLDASYPAERLRYMLEDSAPAVVLVDGVGRAALAGSCGGRLLDVAADVELWSGEQTSNPSAGESGLSPRNLAYVIYTSGSTGSPKGVMVEHRNVSRLFGATSRWFRFDSSDVWTLFHSFSFDFSVWEIWGALAYGGRLVVVPQATARSPEEFYELLCDYGVTILNQTPSAFQQLITAQTGSQRRHRLRRVIFGGEALEVHALAPWYERNDARKPMLVNMYGITETTVHVTYRELTAADARQPGRSPIGRPIPDLRLYLLDGQGEAVPVGVAGEIYVGGAGVARGYLNRPELTAARFVRDPYSGLAGARMYKTGDLGRWLADGSVEYLGRNDDQVKVRGYRIELGEIETRLLEAAGVGEVVAVAREDQPGDKRLVVYYTGEAEPEGLRAQARGVLPEYMVPAAYVRLERLPLTPNGKIDRRALPAPEGEAYGTREYEAPRGENEESLARIWGELLGVERVGRNDNFFELGGHSLLAMRLASRVQDVLGAEIGVGELFANPVLRELALRVAEAGAMEVRPIRAMPREGAVALSLAQQRLWFVSQFDGASRAYHIPGNVRLRGALDRGALCRALERVVARHEALRTRFVAVDGQPTQVIDPVGQGLRIEEDDLRQEVAREEGVRALIEKEGNAAFDLERGPLIRARLLQLDERDHVLMVTMHHIVSDGWSMGVLMNEVSALYGAYSRGGEDPLPALPIQYADYALWQRERLAGEELQRQIEYWKTTLSGAPVRLEVPSDRARPSEQDYVGDDVEIVLGDKLSRGLKALSQRHGCTLYMTLLTGWGLVLGRLAGQEEVVIGSPVAGRTRTEIEKLIGCFVNTLAIRVEIGRRRTVAGLLNVVRARVLEGQERQDLPFEQVVEAVQPPRSMAYTPLFQVMFVWQNAPQGRLSLTGLELGSIGSVRGTAHFDLTLELQEAEDGIRGGLNYATALFEGSTIERYVGYFRNVLEGMVRDDTQEVSRVPLMGAAERRQVLEEWNATAMGYPRDACIHELFEEEVERRPDAIAVVCGEERASYAELNARANRLAHHLRSVGVKPDALVGICVERGVEMVVGLLGVLKAGGGYVPLDASYPAERLRYMLEDSAPAVVLVDGVGRAALGDGYGGRLLEVAAHARLWSGERASNSNARESGLSSRNLAYVIYTSGSTGKPKGVRLPHRAVVNFLVSMQGRPGLRAGDRLLAVTTLSFDIAVLELLLPLTVGAEIVLASREDAIDGQALRGLVEGHGATVMQATPTTWRMLIEAGWSGAPGFKALCGGEPLLGDLADALLERAGEVWNMYGPTETTVWSTCWRVERKRTGIRIGTPIANTQVWILDEHLQPCPIGVPGEIFIGGDGVGLGYLGRPELTAERFVADPFADGGGPMYRTGDLGVWHADGQLECLGRTDLQVKVRGHRIELGEIEAALGTHPGVQQAVALVREDRPGDVRLCAYVVARGQPVDAQALREHLQRTLPEYMVPAAYIRLEKLPLTPNGKVDRKALPAPEGDAYGTREYEAPRGEIEEKLARIWVELLRIERVGRSDNFFELGGHSLLAMTLVERMRRAGLYVDVRGLFTSPTLRELAATVGVEKRDVEVPPNLIEADAKRITPEMLPLVKLSQEAIDRIVARVPGGVGNVQDIYPLAPLQEGILFHHLIEGDGGAYLLPNLLEFATHERLERFSETLQAVIARHDILRTGVMWEGLEEAVQVVQREAMLKAERVEVDEAAGDIEEQLKRLCDSRKCRIDVREAPLLRAFVAEDAAKGRWLMLIVAHHLAIDHTTLELLVGEVGRIEAGLEAELKEPLPYRNYVAQARLGVSREEHEQFFKELLGDIDEPTLPFGLAEVQGDGRAIEEADQLLDPEVARRVRECARRLGVSAASVMHLAMGLVLARVSGRRDVVFGTVMFGRMGGEAGADRTLGLFINTVPVRIRVGEHGVKQSLLETHALLGQLTRHEHAPLALAQRCSHVPAGSPLFSALLNYRYSRVADSAVTTGAEEVGIYLWSEERTNYPLTVSVDDLGAGFRLTAQVSDGVGAARVCGYMGTAVAGLLEALAEAPELAVRRVEVMPAREQRQLLEEWNATATEYPGDRCIHELFEAAVERRPEAVAVVYGEGSVSYAELNARANRLARCLIRNGIGVGDCVAIALERSIGLVVAELGVLKAGGSYVPLDAVLPGIRQVTMLADCQAKVIVTERSYALAPEVEGETRKGRPRRIDVDDDQLRKYSSKSPRSKVESSGAAYVMYTSGTTGVPKGVVVPHRAVVRLVVNNGYADFGPSDGVAFAANPAFDASTMEVWGPLLNGGRVVVIGQDVLLEPGRFGAELERREVSVLWLTVGLFNQYADALSAVMSGLRYLIVGGDALDPAVIAKVLRDNRPQHLLNGYGPTETTTFALTHEIATVAEGARSIPLGRPIGNTRVYILDENREPVPVGVAGELYIGGAGVALGYLNQPELTAERFVGDPYNAVAGARMYRTGDIGRWLADGTVEYLGRNDHQVKVRGYRIELGEVETRLGEAAGVGEVVVMAREDQPGDKRLVAYYTGEAAPEELRAHALGGLPEYMAPAAYVRLERLPLTPNGKVDRKALPAPEGEAYGTREYEAPRGEIEESLARIWGELLGAERVGRNDNFFELGGHSLLAVTLVERMRQAGLHADVRGLFTSRTLGELAATVGVESREVEVPPNLIGADATRITPEMLPLVKLSQEAIDRIVERVPGGAANVQDIYPLAPLQEGILFHHLMGEGAGDTYLLPMLLEFGNQERGESFLETLQAVIDRHDILRTWVMWEGLEEAVQVVQRSAKLKAERVVCDGDAADIEEQLKRRYDLRQYRIDVREAPLLRAFVAEDAKRGRWLMLILAHHLIIDHTTLELLVAEVGKIEGGLETELRAPLPYRTYVAQARLGVSREEHEKFFKELLGDIDGPTLPFGLAEVQGDGTAIEEAQEALDPEVATAVRECARRLAVSAASVVHLAMGLMLARTSGRADVVFGTVLFGRMRGVAGADRALGLFINTVPVRIRVGELSVTQSLRETHALLGQLTWHEHAPLALAQRCSLVPAQTPLFSALLNYRYSSSPHAGGTTGGEEPGIVELWGEERTNYPFTMSVDDQGEGFKLTAQVRVGVGAARVCGYMVRALTSLVEALEEAPELAVRRVEVMPARERREMLEKWNAMAAEYPRDACIHELFEEEVERRPDAIAVVYGEERVSYAELNARANRLAHHLRSVGVEPDALVGLCVERSVEMVVGLLGVLKAGGAYVPLDASYPAERLRYMLEDSAPAVVLVDGVGRAALGDGYGGRLLEVTAHARLWSGERASNSNARESGLSSRNLAYVIYTSGSTGKPKGVRLPHRAVVNFLVSMQGRPGLRAGDRLLAVTTLSFDIAVLELLLPLTVGAEIVLASREDAIDGQALRGLVEGHGATVMQATPTTWRMLIEAGWSGAPGFKALCGGEPLPGNVADALLERAGEVWNMYGPTETTVWSTCWRVERKRTGIRIGTPIANTQVWILDEQLRPCPIGVPGEIFIGGDGVALGYLGRPELTAERFVADPFAGSGGPMYRTGDLGVWHADGQLECLGRTDLQVKVRGHRIELGEIEAALGTHPGVQQAVALVREDRPGDLRLCAYVVAPGETVDAQALRAHLRRTLPEHMVPAAYIRLERLPLTLNGKVDRKALPAPEGDVQEIREDEAPRGDLEEKLARIWADVLNVDRIGRNDNFFELGGHSLLVMRLISHVRKDLRVEMSVHDLLIRPTFVDFASAVFASDSANHGSVLVPIRPHGSLSPLFGIHEGLGTVTYLRSLAKYLNQEVPLYGLEARAVTSDDVPAPSMATMAAQYVSAIREIQPKGPYRLIGYSAGGVIAYAVADHLLAGGEQIEFLGFVDSHVNYGDREGFSEMMEALDTHQVQSVRDTVIFGYNMKQFVPEGQRERFKALTPGGDLSAMIAFMRSAHGIADSMDPRTLEEYFRRNVRVQQTVYQYRPGPVPVGATLFQADNQDEGDQTLGWGALLGERLRTVLVGGDHGTIMEPPHIDRLGEAIGEELERLKMTTSR